MFHRRNISQGSFGVLVAAALTLGLMSSPASAIEPVANETAEEPTAAMSAAADDPESVEVTQSDVQPTTDTILIDGTPTDIKVMPDFDPEAPVVVFNAEGRPISVDTITLLSANGEMKEMSAVSSTDKAALASCWQSWVAPGTGTWFYSVNGCGAIGFDHTATVSYEWFVSALSDGTACLKGRGYRERRLPGGGSVHDEIYPSIGCGKSGGGSVSWGNVASNKRVQMMSMSFPAGASGQFQ